MVVQRMLWRLHNIETTIKHNARSIEKRNGELAGLRAELTKHEDALSVAQRQQAQARGEVMKKEQAIKKQEKALEAKVRRIIGIGRFPILFRNPQCWPSIPKLLTLNAKSKMQKRLRMTSDEISAKKSKTLLDFGRI